MTKEKHYYKAVVELGHSGAGKSTTTCLYLKATSAYSAMKKAQKIPAVKHNKIPLKIMQISEDDYIKGINSEDYYNTISML